MKHRRYFTTAANPVEDAACAVDILSEEAASSSKGKPTFPSKRSHLAKVDPYPGDPPVDSSRISHYQHGRQMKLKETSYKAKFHRVKFQQREQRFAFSRSQAARSEILANEDAGFIQPDPGKFSHNLSQGEIVESVDIASATKHFSLDLEKLGPYRVDYTRNGRHVLLGGKMGHVAAFDWLSKKLHCEISTMETVRDVQWLHLETMFAVSQKKWTYVYDNQGTELHCLKNMHHCLRLEFLPFHFLLVGSSAPSFLHWLDISIGKMVASFPIREGRLGVLCQNPANAVICLGHAKGTVSMWTPTSKEPLVKMLCHPAPVTGLTIDGTGTYMATAGVDRQLRIWDLRTYGQLSSHLLPVGASHLQFSQRRLLAASVGADLYIFKDMCRLPESSSSSSSSPVSPYLKHHCSGTISDLGFCPFEDVLGIGEQNGFVSVLVPGAGEPNIDALEANPYRSKKQRREFEVKHLLDKIQPEMIGLEPSGIIEVDQAALEDKMEKRSKIIYLKPSEVKLKKKRKARMTASKQAKRAKTVAEQQQTAELKEQARLDIEDERALAEKEDSNSDIVSSREQEAGTDHPVSVLDRFKKKKTKKKLKDKKLTR